MSYEMLDLERSGAVLTIRLNRPEKLNAIDERVMNELVALCAELRTDRDTRFVILTGEGRAFSSGADLGGFPRSGEGAGRIPPQDAMRLGQLRGQEMMRSLEQLEQVTVAAVNGVCLGAGVALIMACDFRLAARGATLGLPETNIGYFFTWGSTPRLSRIVGPSRAKRGIMTCENVGAQQALEWGLIDEVVPDGQLLESCHELIGQIARNGEIAVRLTKKLVNAHALQGMAELFVCEPELAGGLALSGEPQAMAESYLAQRRSKE
jgi:enoyl-CoA hydratase/carnithine racemase